MKVSDLRNIIASVSSGAEVSFDVDGEFVECGDVKVTEYAGRQSVVFVLEIGGQK